METDRSHMTKRILNLTLEIIYLLTGENYVAFKFSDGLVASNLMKTQHPAVQPPSHSLRKNKKVQEVTSEIIELLTGEVPIRCQDGTVHFSMEGWEYLEGHKNLYEDDMMENQAPLPSPDGSRNRNTPDRSPLYSRDSTQEHQEIHQARPLYSRDSTQQHQKVHQARPLYSRDCTQEHQKVHQTRPLYSQDSTQEHQKVHQAHPLYPRNSTKEQQRIPQDYQEEDLTAYKTQAIDEDVIYVRGDEQCKAEEISPEISADPGDTQRDIKVEEEEEEESVNYVKIEEDEIPIVISAGQQDEVNNMEHRGMISSEMGNDITYDSSEENSMAALRHSVPYSADLSSDPSTYVRSFPSHSPPIAHHRGGEPFPCSIDGHCLTQRAGAMSHQMPHTSEKPYSCSVCGKCFTQVGYLPLHERTHTGVKPYSCNECGKSFSFNSTLNRHKIVHTGEKPFSCSECGRCFSLNSTLIKHQRTHTGEKPFSCSECGKCFTRRDHLMIHQRTHTGVKPYSCSACGKCFTRKASLLEHQRTHTGERP